MSEECKCDCHTPDMIIKELRPEFEKLLRMKFAQKIVQYEEMAKSDPLNYWRVVQGVVGSAVVAGIDFMVQMMRREDKWSTEVLMSTMRFLVTCLEVAKGDIQRDCTNPVSLQ